LRNCAKFLPFYPSKFSIQIRYTFSLSFALNSFSARHQNCYLKRDQFAISIWLYKLTCFGHRAHSSYHIFGHIKFTYLLRKVMWPPINVIHKLSISITQTSCIEFNAKFSNCYISVIS